MERNDSRGIQLLVLTKTLQNRINVLRDIEGSVQIFTREIES